MAVRKPRPIPFDQVVKPIVDEPLQMRFRLDFADWLANNGHGERAGWIRKCCSICSDVHPLSLGRAGWRSYSFVKSPPLGVLDFEGTQLHAWHDCLPDYIEEINDVTFVAYFGRLTVNPDVNEPKGLIQIGRADWLPQAFHDGWIECLRFDLFNSNCIASLLEWPDLHKTIPFAFDPAGSFTEKLESRVMRQILEFPGLHSLNLTQRELSNSCCRSLARVAPNLRFLSLSGLRPAKTTTSLLEQLSELRHLRSLGIGDKVPDDDTIRLIAETPRLSCLRLYSRHLSGSGLMSVAEMTTLRHLCIDLERVTRKDIYELRNARPELQIIVEGDMRKRLGPV